MKEEKNFVVEFVKQTLMTFASAVITVSIVGWFVGDGTKEVGGLLGLGRDGLSYASLLQLFVFSFIAAGIKLLLLSNYFIKNMMLLWRTVFMFLLTFLLAIILVILFRWIPLDSLEAWFGFILSITGGFFIGLSSMIIKTKLEDKKYNILLSDYKKKQK